MPRLPVIYSDEYPYHVIARSNNRDWFGVEMNYCYGVFINVLFECYERFSIQLHTFVLMNNHFHMMVSTPKKNIDTFLRYFMTETSRGIRMKSDRINHIYGGRNHKSLITHPAYYAHCYKYVYRNPVAANICEKIEDYQWTSASKTPSKIKRLISPPSKDLLEYIPVNRTDYSTWLNQPLSKEIEDQCRKALKRSKFHFKPSRQGQKLPDIYATLHTQNVPGTKLLTPVC